MLIKCKTKGSRVKGVVFHPRLHFLLASMHSGEIQMWDYLNSTLVEVFSEHDGPVRGIDFHLEQPLFVSGGDDTSVIVWDFAQRRKLFSLMGHLDYVRTVHFHTQYPWVISASDDQTIRIWNWQSRSCLCVVSGHNHYVMSAIFHPTLNLIISASLDHTSRIWDMNYLVEKKCSLKPPLPTFLNNVTLENPQGGFDIDVGGVSDVICLHTLTGHTSGVNYAIFFGENMAATAGDDCSIRIWRYTEFSFYQTNILRDHEDNVTCLLLVKDYLLSTSEDHSIRIWDLNTFSLVHTYVMDEDRFWSISKSRHNNYITAGHDSGLIVFKLYKERPSMALSYTKDRNLLYYAWNNNLYLNNLENECNSYFKELLHYSNTTGSTGVNRTKDVDWNILYYKWLENNSNNKYSSNSEDNDNRLVFQCPSGSYLSQRTLIATITEEKKGIMPSKVLVNPYCKDRPCVMVIYNNGKSNYMEMFSFGRGQLEFSFKTPCNTAAFLNENTLVVVEKSALVYTTRGEIVTELEGANKVSLSSNVEHPTNNTNKSSDKDVSDIKVFGFGRDTVLFFNKKTNTLSLYDTKTKLTVHSANTPYGHLFEVLVNSYGFIACLFRNFVVVFDRNLNRITYKQQFNRIKSGLWHNNTSVIYSTYNQIHYLLINGSFGVLCTMASPTYLLKIVNTFENKQVLYLVNRQHRCFKHLIDSPDYSLKHSLLVNDLETANNLVNSGQMFGRFTCSYLINNRKYDLARKLLNNDNVNKFYLSIQFGNLQNALKDAKVLNNKFIWNYLGDASLELGNVTMAELSYQKSKQYNKLSLLYLITGDFGKLRKMLNMCKIHNNKSLTLLHSLYLGDMEELSSVLSDSGHEQLSSICNNTYLISDHDGSGNDNPNSKYLLPPKPINRLDGDMLNWSVKTVELNDTKFNINEIVELNKKEEPAKHSEADLFKTLSESMENSMAELGLTPMVVTKGQKHPQVKVHDYRGLHQTDGQVVSVQLMNDRVVVHTGGISSDTNEMKKVSSRIDEGDPFEEILQDNEMETLEFHDVLSNTDNQDNIWEEMNKSDGLTNEERLFQFLKNKDYSSALNFLNQLYGEVNVTLLKNTLQQLDLTRYTLLQQVNTNQLNEKLNMALNYFQNAELESCLNNLKQLMRDLFLYKTLNINVTKALDYCYWYSLAINLETERDASSERDLKRSLELAGYLTCCKLEPRHQYLVLRKTVGLMWKAKNFQTAATMVNRLLKLDTSQFEVDQVEIDKAKKIHTLCLQKGTNQYELDLDEGDFTNLQICTFSLYKLHQEATVTCLFCGSYAYRKYLNQYCKHCQLLKLV